jgi:hypothetical protein
VAGPKPSYVEASPEPKHGQRRQGDREAARSRGIKSSVAHVGTPGAPATTTIISQIGSVKSPGDGLVLVAALGLDLLLLLGDRALRFRR